MSSFATSGGVSTTSSAFATLATLSAGEVPATPTVLPVIDGPGFAARLAGLFPPGWAAPEALKNNGGVYGLLLTWANELAIILSEVTYAQGSARTTTAVAPELDLAAVDYFGTGLTALPRVAGESDSSYRARILAALFPEGATRKAVSDAVKRVTGVAPRIIEPWSPLDTGVIDGAGGAGMMFLDIDDPPVAPAIITDPSLRYQGFLQSVLPTQPILGGQALPCIDVGNTGDGLYFDIAGSSMFDFTSTIANGAAAVYNAINMAKTFGTVVWVQFVNSVP